MRPVPVLLVTYNRLEYSKRALESILRAPGIPVAVTIWDNASTDGTVEWLRSLAISDCSAPSGGIMYRIFNDTNVGLAPVMNSFFRAFCDCPFVVKVDNDTVLPDNWLRDLMDVMTNPYREAKLGAVSGTCLRPNGDTFKSWVDKYMVTRPFGEHKLHYNSYVLGTGVLINMDLIRTRGLLFEKFPRSPESGPDDPCLISGWTAYIRAASEFEGWKFAFYSKVPVNLLNIAQEHVLSGDYPEYDAEVQVVRDAGNRWWESVGGLEGCEKYVAEHGGLEKIHAVNSFDPAEYSPVAWHGKFPMQTVDLRTLTEASNVEERSKPEFWEKRIAAHGTNASTFLATPQARINEFTDRHMEILREYAKDADVLDVACGWGRISMTLSRMAKSYIGVDFMEPLIEKARESMPHLDFKVADAKALPFKDASFDCVVAVTGLSSFAGVFDQVLKEFHRVLRPGGRILFLEERFARIDWKLEHE